MNKQYYIHKYLMLQCSSLLEMVTKLCVPGNKREVNDYFLFL
jgi:hypothetical protein